MELEDFKTCDFVEELKKREGVETDWRVKIVESQFINSDSVKVSFEVPCADWCLIQQSENWQRIQNFLEVSESRGSQMSLTDKVRLLEKGET